MIVHEPDKAVTFGTDSLTLLESEIATAGHQLERRYEGAVANAPGPGDPGWCVRVDGQSVAPGGSVGRVEAVLRGWWGREEP
jgi:hypothetical protein